MNKSKAVDPTQGVTNSVGPYTVYAAGGLFTEHELATNVLIKEAIWRLSNGQFQLVLPQSREMRELNRPDRVSVNQRLSFGVTFAGCMARA